MQRLAIGCLCLILSSPLFADEMKVPVGQQGDQSQSRPTSGMSTETVQDKYGSPENMTDAVGDPPISIWNYASFSVYFEHDRVIHTVLHKS